MKAYSNSGVALLLALGALAGITSSVSAAPIPWTVRGVESAGTAILDVADAEKLLSGQIQSSTDVTGHFDVINFNEPSNVVGGLFPNSVPFPGTSTGHEKNFAEDVTGNIEIPKAGDYSFGVSSDDGFSLTVGSHTMSYPGLRSPAESYSTFDFTKAGAYAVNLVYFQHTVNAELELFASPGKYTKYGQTGSNFRLIGDTAHGGLALANPGVGSPVPEPSAFMLLIPLSAALLVRRRRARA
jgi:hypothetical protein